jgi:hypothetical protein
VSRRPELVIKECFGPNILVGTVELVEKPLLAKLGEDYFSLIRIKLFLFEN